MTITWSSTKWFLILLLAGLVGCEREQRYAKVKHNNIFAWIEYADGTKDHLHVGTVYIGGSKRRRNLQ